MEINSDKMKAYFDIHMFSHNIPLDGHNVTLIFSHVSGNQMIIVEKFDKVTF
jgi:hypothetical protein